MYYYEKDYIMRLIHGISRALARLLLGEEMEEDGELAAVMEEACRDRNDYLRRLADGGRINEAEEKLFDLIENTAWDSRQKAALILSFYDHLNGMDDETLARADFSRDEIVSGLEDAMKAARMEIPEYLRI